MVEEILGSRGRIRVLQVLTESGELNISEVSRRTGLNYTSVQRHLMKLKELFRERQTRERPDQQSIAPVRGMTGTPRRHGQNRELPGGDDPDDGF